MTEYLIELVKYFGSDGRTTYGSYFRFGSIKIELTNFTNPETPIREALKLLPKDAPYYNIGGRRYVDSHTEPVSDEEVTLLLIITLDRILEEAEGAGETSSVDGLTVQDLG